MCGQQDRVMVSAVKDLVLRGLLRAVLETPVVRLVGRNRRQGLDEQLDPQPAAVLELQRMLRYRALESMEPAHARRYAAEGLSPVDIVPAPMAQVIDTAVRGSGGPIPVRIFVPDHATSSWIVYLHGGGGVIG